jgi:HicB family
MPPALHAELARAAERDGVSLNGFITSKLGESVGWSRAEPRSPSVDRRSAPRTIVLVLIANAVAVAFAAAAALVILLVAVLG